MNGDTIHTAATYPRFRAALEAGDMDRAFEVARYLPGLLSLLDALALTLLANEKERTVVFQSCAARWLARVAVEKSLTRDAIMDAGAVFQAAERGEAPEAFRELSALL